jgi:putative SOS response-associated peptidase YedK
MRWGLIPSWASSIKAIKSPLINARADTIQSRPSYKKAFLQRRCLVIANVFVEWSLEGSIKQPYFFQLTTKEPMAFAGVWEKWTNNEMSVDSFTIITGEPNAFISSKNRAAKSHLNGRLIGPIAMLLPATRNNPRCVKLSSLVSL